MPFPCDLSMICVGDLHDDKDTGGYGAGRTPYLQSTAKQNRTA